MRREAKQARELVVETAAAADLANELGELILGRGMADVCAAAAVQGNVRASEVQTVALKWRREAQQAKSHEARIASYSQSRFDSINGATVRWRKCAEAEADSWMAYRPVAASATSCLEGEFALDRLWEDHLPCGGGARGGSRSAASSAASSSASSAASSP